METANVLVCQMGIELILRHESAEQLAHDFEANLRKGRAFVPGSSGLSQRELCGLRIEHPERADAFRVRAEAVWIDTGSPGGTGLSFIDFDAAALAALRAFVAAAPGSSATPDGPSEAPDAELSSPSSPSSRNLHERVRGLELSARDVLARQGSLPERVALERRFGSSVWEGLLHNPQVTPREVLRMAKSSSLPTALVNLIVANRAWVTDAAIQRALLENPRVAGTHLDRVLRALPQAEIQRVAEQTSVRMQVRQAAKRLIRR